MFIRVLKECKCTFSFWHDRHWGDRGKEDAWEEMERQETLEMGKLFRAVRVSFQSKQHDCCNIDKSSGDMPESYLNVPCYCIEILEGDPE